MLHIPLTKYDQQAAKQEPCQQAYFLHTKYWRIFHKKVRRMGQWAEKKKKTESRDSKVESNDSRETQDRWETSDILGLPSGLKRGVGMYCGTSGRWRANPLWRSRERITALLPDPAHSNLFETWGVGSTQWQPSLVVKYDPAWSPHGWLTIPCCAMAGWPFHAVPSTSTVGHFPQGLNSVQTVPHKSPSDETIHLRSPPPPVFTYAGKWLYMHVEDPAVHVRVQLIMKTLEKPSMHFWLGSKTLLQPAFLWESDPNFPREKSQWDNRTVKIFSFASNIFNLFQDARSMVLW